MADDPGQGAANKPGNEAAGSWDWVKQITIAQVLFGLLAFLAIGLIGFALYHAGGGFLDSLKDIDVARGLITFLVVFTTVIIAIILVIYIATSTTENVKDRFGFGKEILTALIGILGTILGFYFGQSVGTGTTLQIAPAYISKENPKADEAVVLYSFVSGGKPPYTYSITVKPDDSLSLKDKPSAQGVIKEELKIPSTLPKDKDTVFTFEITVKDSTGKSLTYNDPTKKFTVKAENAKP